MTQEALTIAQRYKTLLHREGIIGSLVFAHFFAQLAHESGLKPISENLNYSESGLLKIFKKYFTPAEAKEFARKPEKIANRVYANRMGNGDEASGDGFKFRGRGFIQLTGKNNYKALSTATGIDYVSNPDLLLTETDALIAAIWFWNSKGLTKYALADDILTITKRINGGTNGLEDRKKHLIEMKKLFKS